MSQDKRLYRLTDLEKSLLKVISKMNSQLLQANKALIKSNGYGFPVIDFFKETDKYFSDDYSYEEIIRILDKRSKCDIIHKASLVKDVSIKQTWYDSKISFESLKAHYKKEDVDILPDYFPTTIDSLYQSYTDETTDRILGYEV
tara:strand:+ start:454 stop:885 length:432 start_codon:yes stop_codon:yes gene_type:complete